MAVLPARMKNSSYGPRYIPYRNDNDPILQAQCIGFPLELTNPGHLGIIPDLCESYPGFPINRYFPFGTAISNRAPSPGSPVSFMVISFIDRISWTKKRPRPVFFP